MASSTDGEYYSKEVFELLANHTSQSGGVCLAAALGLTGANAGEVGKGGYEAAVRLRDLAYLSRHERDKAQRLVDAMSGAPGLAPHQQKVRAVLLGGGQVPPPEPGDAPPPRPHSVPVEAPLGVRVLCIDGGGIRGVMPLQYLRMLRERTGGREPHQLFDLICGTSTGGIIAVLLGLFKAKLDDVIELYDTIGQKVFSKGRGEKLMNFVVTGGRHGKALSGMVDAVVQRYIKALPGDPRDAAGVSMRRLHELQGPGTPHVFVVATREDNGAAFILRSYGGDDAAGSSSVPVADAVKATSAAPTYFPMVEVRVAGIRYPLVDGGLVANNPAQLALGEYRQVPGNEGRSLRCLVSLGTGKNLPRMDPPRRPCWRLCSTQADRIKRTMELIVKSATNSQRVNTEIERNPPAGGTLFERFDPPIPDLPLDDDSAVEWLKRQAATDVAENKRVRDALMMVADDLK